MLTYGENGYQTTQGWEEPLCLQKQPLSGSLWDIMSVCLSLPVVPTPAAVSPGKNGSLHTLMENGHPRLSSLHVLDFQEEPRLT